MKKLFKSALAATISGTALLWAGMASAVEIEYWQYTYQSRVDAVDKLIANFEATNPDITVKQTHFPYADYRKKVAIAVSAGDGPDVVQLFYGWLNDYVEAQLIQPLPSDAFPPAISTNSSKVSGGPSIPASSKSLSL